MNDRKRLKLMPEVLPDPRPKSGAGSVRARTVAHVQRILAGAAAAAASACAKAPAPTVAPLAEGSRSEADAGAVAMVETAEPKPTATEVPTAVAVPTGYAVVDPVPPPSACPGLAARVPNRASWKQAPGGPVVEVLLSKATGPEVVSYHNSTAMVYGGGSIQSQSGGKDTLRLMVKVAPGVTSISMALPALCNGQPVNFSIGLDVQKTPRVGDPVPMQLSSY